MYTDRIKMARCYFHKHLINLGVFEIKFDLNGFLIIYEPTIRPRFSDFNILLEILMHLFSVLLRTKYRTCQISNYDVSKSWKLWLRIYQKEGFLMNGSLKWLIWQYMKNFDFRTKLKSAINLILWTKVLKWQSQILNFVTYKLP